MNYLLRSLILCLVSSSLLMVSCKEPEEKTVSTDKEEYQLEEQKEVGNNFVTYVNQLGIYNILDKSEHAEIYDYVGQLWASTVNNQSVITRLDFDWEVFIIHDDDIRTAFSVPGGKLFIYTGLLKAISNESELFGIMAHELYYIDRGATLSAMISEYGTLIVGDIWLGSDTNGARDLAETIYQLQIPSYEVIEADRFAINLICPYRYDPKGLKSFLELAHNASYEIDWLLTRPGEEDRTVKIEDMAVDCGSEEFKFVERYEEYKAMLP